MFLRLLGAIYSIRIVTPSGAERLLIEDQADGLQDLESPGWSASGRMVYFQATAPDGGRGLYEIPSAGDNPRLLVRFDDPAMNVFRGSSVAVGNGRFYFAIGEMESDIYVTDVERR